MYAIVDIETTGGAASRSSICEVAIIIHDGEKVVKEYQSLINPERPIPSTLTAIHGINDFMVADAPKFYEEAKTIHELLEGNIFVAHSVNFDYSFIKAAFQDLGYDLKLKKLCTVRLSRKIFPGLKSYSLGIICENRGIIINDRHRAYGDAIATAHLFTQLVQNDTNDVIQTSLKNNATVANIPDNLERKVFDELPQSPGVYYFLNQKSQIIYVGKAKNIKKRVSSHFGGNKEEIKKQAFQSQIHHVDYYLTGNELIALLHESHEIRKNWPRYNKAQKNNKTGYSIYLYEDRQGYQRLQLARKQAGMQSLMRFPNHASGFAYLNELSKKLKICPKFAGIQSSPAACFDYRLGECQGACIGEESQTEHNKKIEAFVDYCNEEKSDYIIIGTGRSKEEFAFALVEEGSYQGFGFFTEEEQIMHWEDFKNHLIQYPDHPEIYKILSSESATKNYRKIKKAAFGKDK